MFSVVTLSIFLLIVFILQSVFGAEEYKCLGPYNASFCEKTPGGGATHHPGIKFGVSLLAI